MRIYISVDMEGCSGVLFREQTNPMGYDYQTARQLMTAEADAAIRGAFEGGATEVVVSDSHGGNGMRNFVLEALDPRAEVIIGSPRKLGQLEGLTGGFGAVLLVGYHTRHGAAGVLSHTTNGQAVANLWLNEQLVGEIGLNARLAGHFGVPVTLVSGDDLTIAEAKAELPEIEGVVVKRALGRYTARCLHPERARELIRQGATLAVRKAPEAKPFPAPRTGRDPWRPRRLWSEQPVGERPLPSSWPATAPTCCCGLAARRRRGNWRAPGRTGDGYPASAFRRICASRRPERRPQERTWSLSSCPLRA